MIEAGSIRRVVNLRVDMFRADNLVQGQRVDRRSTEVDEFGSRLEFKVSLLFIYQLYPLQISISTLSGTASLRHYITQIHPLYPSPSR